VLEIITQASNLSSRGDLLIDQRKYYSAASFCFRSNIGYRHAIITLRNLSEVERIQKLNQIDTKIRGIERELDNVEILTITDLQAYMIVQDRISDAKSALSDAREIVNDTVVSPQLIAYTEERVFSALSWKEFLGLGGEEIKFDQELLKKGCQSKISEAEERNSYVNSIMPMRAADRRGLDESYVHLRDEDYALCLFKASKAKAEADIILSVVGADEERVQEIISQKQDAVKRTLIRSQKRGSFPILGYSYYEYTDVLRDEDPFSALLFSEYALELTNLDLYFGSSKSFLDREPIKIPQIAVIAFILGVLIGVSFVTYGRKRSR